MAIKPYGNRHFELGEFADDAGALAFIQARKWDHDGSGSGNPREGMTYWNTTEKTWRKYGNGAWRTEASLMRTVAVTDATTNVTVADNNSIFATMSAGLKTFNLPTGFDGGRYRFARSQGPLKLVPNGSERIFVYRGTTGDWWDSMQSYDNQQAFVDIVGFPGAGWFMIDGAGNWYDSDGAKENKTYLGSIFRAGESGRYGAIPCDAAKCDAGSYSLVFGTRNEVPDSYSFGFGYANRFSGKYSGGLGRGAYCDWDNAFVIGGFQDSYVGDDRVGGKVQGGFVLLKGYTSGESSSDVLDSADGNDLPTQEQSTLQLRITVIGRKNGAEGMSASWEISAGFEHRTVGAGGPVLKGINKIKLWGDSGTEDWDVVPSIVNGGGDNGKIEITVSSDTAGLNVNWAGRIDWLEVGVGTQYTPVDD